MHSELKFALIKRFAGSVTLNDDLRSKLKTALEMVPPSHPNFKAASAAVVSLAQSSPNTLSEVLSSPEVVNALASDVSQNSTDAPVMTMCPHCNLAFEVE
jgi:hypothetical protein